MSKLSKLIGDSKEVEINGEKFILSPLRSKDLGLFSQESMTNEQKINASNNIIRLSLEKKMPDVTLEEVENLDVKVFIKLMDAINELNGFVENESAIRKIKEQIISRK